MQSSKKSKHRSRSKDRNDYSSSKKSKRSSRSRTRSRSRSPQHHSHRHSSSHQTKSSTTTTNKSLSPDTSATTALIKSAFPNLEKISTTLVNSITTHQANVTKSAAAAAAAATTPTKPAMPTNMVLSSFNNNPFKLNNVKKPPSQAALANQLNPNFNPLIPTNLNNYTTTVLAARAAAIAAANSVNLQIMQQSNHLKPSSATVSTSNGVIVTQPLRPQGLTTTIYTNSHNAGVINTVTTTNTIQYSHQEATKNSSHLTEAQLNAEKEAEQKRLEEEMRKRRERIEKWRNEKKQKEEAKESGNAATATGNDKKANNGNNGKCLFIF